MPRKHFISHLAHAEILTPKLEESVHFFKEVMGMDESGREGQSVYLRCWGEYYHHSLVLTEGPQPALGHIGWRTHGPDELESAVQQIEATGQGEGWYEHTPGHGRAYRFRGPGGHLQEIFWEVERYVAPPELRSTYPARPQRFTGRGVAPRQIDHATVASLDVMKDTNWYCDTLGFRFMEYTVPDEVADLVVFTQTTTNEKSHGLGFVADFSGVPGRINHLAFFVQRSRISSGVPISCWRLERPSNMVLVSMAWGTTLSLLPRAGRSAHRAELRWYRNYVPDWEPVKWVPSQGSNSMYRNSAMPDSMTESFPPAAGPSFPEPAAMAGKEPVAPNSANFFSKRGQG